MADLLSDADVMGQPQPVPMGGKLLSDADVLGHDKDADEAKAPEKKDVPTYMRPAVGANRVIADIAGAPVDATAWALNHTVVPAINKGAEALGFKAPVQEFKDPLGGSESIKRGMGYVGANPDDVTPPSTSAQRILEAAGAGAASMVLPGLGAEAALSRTAGDTFITAALDMIKGSGPVSNAAVGAASGAGGDVAASAVPEPYKPIAAMAGGLASGVGAAGALAAGGAGGAAARGAYQAVTEPAEMRAARAVLGRASAPGKFRQDVAEAAETPPLVEGSAPTTFQATGDLGIGSYEREIAASPTGVAPFAARRVEQNTARLEALGKLADPSADSQVVTDYVRSRLAAITEDHAAKVATATRSVADSLAQAGGQHFDNPAAYGEALQVPLSGLHQKAETAASALWRAIDPDMEAVVNPTPLKQGVAELMDTIPKTAKPPEGEEAAIMSTVAKMGDDTNFKELVALRSRTTEAIRDERRDGSPTVQRRLNIILSHIDNTLANTAGEIAADPVAAPSMIQSLQAEAKEWMARSADERKSGVITGVGFDGSGGSVAGRRAGNVPPALGDQGQAGGQSRLPAGDQGVQGAIWKNADHDIPVQVKPDSAPSRGPDGRMYQEVIFEGKSSFVPADELEIAPAANRGAAAGGISPEIADRYAAARNATREMKQTYDSGPVGAVLAPGDRYGTFKMTASNVARNLFDRPEALKAFVEAAKGDPEALAPMKDYAAFSLRQAAVKDGMLSPQRYQKWIDDHGYVLRQFPELAGKFENVKAAQATLDSTFSAQKEALTDYQTSAARRFLDGQDPTQAAGKALANPGEFAALAAHVSADPAAAAGLKRAVVDYMMSKALSTAESGTSGNPQINAATLQKFYLQNRSALASLFDKDELGNIERITADLQRANRSIVAVKIPGGSNTAQDTGNRAMSVLQSVIQKNAGKAVGGTTGGPIGFVAGAAVDALRAARMDRIDKAVVEMMLDPKMAAIWLAKVPEKTGESAAASFIRMTRAAVANQVMNAVEQEKETDVSRETSRR